VLPEGSMVGNLPIGSKEVPQTIIGKKNSSLPNPKYTPSPLCNADSTDLKAKSASG